ncbi:MAG TPA: circadian clock KaiB family protein [Terriglobales bacterium]|nr:circadian clock KaiB family protein [Terriglobales bacterium]
MPRTRPADDKGEGRAARTSDEFQQQLADESGATVVLRLYVAGTNLHSVRAIENTRRLCAEFLRGRCELHVIDLYQQPSLAQRDRILTVPALVKLFPPPTVRFVGDMSDTDKILRGLGIVPGKTRNK